MKKGYIAATLLTLSTIIACTKDSDLTGQPTSPPPSTSNAPANVSSFITGQARLSGNNYSQSISIDTANKMLSSYLTSVGYPAVDTAIRSLSFDADTLRAYLQNQNIVTLKFMVAHRPEYINSGSNGKVSSMRPDVLTLIVVGMDNEQRTVLNNKGGVYDHFSGCPAYCPAGVNSPFIQ